MSNSKYNNYIQRILSYECSSKIIFLEILIGICVFTYYISTLSIYDCNIARGEIIKYNICYKQNIKQIYVQYIYDNKLNELNLIANEHCKVIHNDNDKPKYINIYKTYYNINGLIFNYNNVKYAYDKYILK